MASLRSDETRFGASWCPPERAAAVLRARAVRFGLHPEASPDVFDVAAAVVGADAWMLALGASNLENPRRHGVAAVRALAAVLARAAGTPVSGGDPFGGGQLAAGAWLVEIERYERWAAAASGDCAEVLRRAASDLAAGAEDGKLSGMAEALATAAVLADDS